MPDTLERLKAALADRYTLQRELGRGGMATVYLAEDLKHHRPVALKVLRPELAAALGPDRFLREIELSARLTHPHILPVYDSGRVSGWAAERLDAAAAPPTAQPLNRSTAEFLYYVMPYVEGESLRDRLTREKQLPVDDALQISREVADALSYAHSHGVIHRDIKPENILLESGHAVVADFGIARAIDAAGGERLTETGVAMGTPQYMSPEQAGGSRDLDGRSDLYSLGCVLYEMLAGQPPFTGPTVESLVRQHLSAEPPNITNIRPSVPSWVVAALQRALAKTPADRFNPVAQFGEAIAPRVSTVEVPVTAPQSRSWLGWAAGLVLAAALVASLVVWGPLGTLVQGKEDDALPAPRAWVIVADFEGTADPSYRRAARDLVGTVLDQSTVAATLPTDQVRRGLELAGRPETTTVTEVVARELAVRGSIGSVITGQLDRVGSSYSVLLRLVRAESGEVLAAENRTAGDDDALIPTLEDAVRALRERMDERRVTLQASRRMHEVMTPSFEAYRKYAEARRLLQEEYDYAAAGARCREALALDPDFASAWSFLGVLYLQGLRQPDSGCMALNEAAQRPERLTGAERLVVEGLIARHRWHLREAVNAYDQALRERPNDASLWNSRAVALAGQRGPEVMLEALDHIRTFEPFEPTLRVRNRVVSLIAAGRRAEAREAALGIASGLVRLGFLLAIAGLDADWVQVDSLEREYRQHSPSGATRWRAVQHYVRGEVRAGDSILRGIAEAPWALQGLAAGRPVTRPATPDTTWAGAVTAALAGDTAEARAALPRLTADTLDWRVESGYWPAAVEAVIAWQAKDWRGVIRHAGAILRERAPVMIMIGTSVRWITADAHARLGQLDSAAGLLSELVEPGRMDGAQEDTRVYASEPLPGSGASS